MRIRLGYAERGAERGHNCIERDQPVFGFEPRRLGGTLAARHEPVPAPQPPGPGHQPFAWTQIPAVVILGDVDEGEPRGEFGRAFADPVGKAVRNRHRRLRARPVAAVGGLGSGAERCVRITP